MGTGRAAGRAGRRRVARCRPTGTHVGRPAWNHRKSAIRRSGMRTPDDTDHRHRSAFGHRRRGDPRAREAGDDDRGTLRPHLRPPAVSEALQVDDVARDPDQLALVAGSRLARERPRLGDRCGAHDAQGGDSDARGPVRGPDLAVDLEACSRAWGCLADRQQQLDRSRGVLHDQATGRRVEERGRDRHHGLDANRAVGQAQDGGDRPDRGTGGRRRGRRRSARRCPGAWPGNDDQVGRVADPEPVAVERALARGALAHDARQPQPRAGPSERWLESGGLRRSRPERHAGVVHEPQHEVAARLARGRRLERSLQHHQARLGGLAQRRRRPRQGIW